MPVSPNPIKNGLVAITLAVKAVCRVTQRYGPKIDAAIDEAATAGLITGLQQVELKDWLHGITVFCDILRQITGY